MAQENVPFVPATLDPLRFLERLPSFSGDKKDLYTFISLVDRINPLFNQYCELSQLLFIDLIKSRFQGKAKEAIEINFHVQTWAEIKEVLINYFGENQSAEQLYDNLRSVVFRTNVTDFYNEIKDKLRSLNNKIVTDLGINFNSEEIARNNMMTSLKVFKEKMPEPMKTILACRDPETLEEAMNILFISGYANYGNNEKNFNFASQTGNNNNGNFKGVPNNRNIRSYPRINFNRNGTGFENNLNRNNFIRPNCNNGFQQNNNSHNNNRNNSSFYQNRGPSYNSHNNSSQSYSRNFPNSNRNYIHRHPTPEPMDINIVRNLNRSTNFQSMPVAQNEFQPNMVNNFPSPYQNCYFNDPSLELNNMTQSCDSKAHSCQPNLENNRSQFQNLNHLSQNDVAQNFRFPASPENYHI